MTLLQWATLIADSFVIVALLSNIQWMKTMTAWQKAQDTMILNLAGHLGDNLKARLTTLKKELEDGKENIEVLQSLKAEIDKKKVRETEANRSGAV